MTHQFGGSKSIGYTTQTFGADAAMSALGLPVSASAPTRNVHEPATAVPQMTTYRTARSASTAPITQTMTTHERRRFAADEAPDEVQQHRRQTGADQTDGDEVRHDHDDRADDAAGDRGHDHRPGIAGAGHDWRR